MLQPSRTLVRRTVSLAAAATVVASVLTASAQLRIRRNPIMGGIVDPTADAGAEDGKDTPVGVTVPDSPGAVERLDHAAEKEQQKQWKTAADFYREAVTQFAGRVVPSTSDRIAGTYRYTGVAAAVQERIARWPAEGLAVYRNLYGPAAAERLAGAARGDLATLSSVFYDDFVTDAGKGAGLRLIDAYTEAGDFPAAAAIGDRLLDLHPMLGADRPTILFRTAVANHWGGDDVAANKRLAELKRTDAKAIGSVGGKDVVLADALAAALAVPAPTPAVDPTAADTYPSFGGPGGRGDVSPSTAKPGASLNTVMLTPPEFGGGNAKSQAEQDRGSLAGGGARGVMPVVDAGTLFFQDGRTLYAVDADSGMPVPAWLATYPAGGAGQPGGRYHMSVPGRARGEQLTVTVTPTSVMAVMGQRDRAANGNAGMFNGGFVLGGNGGEGGGPPSPVRLVCLDRATGRERWKATPADLPDAAGAARTAEYGGTPLGIPAAVAGTPDDAVLVVARGGKDGQFDNCYVVCLSARSGQYRWSTYIGSGTRSFDGETIFGQDPSQLSLADGRAFVMSNLGTVAALDPADGRVLWLDAYTRDNSENVTDIMQRQQSGNAAPGRPWSCNPVVVQGGHVFALPADAKSLFVLDAATGQQLRRVDMKQFGNADVLLGVRDGFAVLTADHAIFGVDWRQYAPDNPQSARWQEEPWFGDANTSTSIAARGFLTANGIYVVNGENLSELDWRHHKLVSQYPSNGTFDKTGGQGPGNILVTSQNVVVAGQDRVDVYTDLGVVRAKYEREMAAAPTDPEPRVRYATALFAGGQTTDALVRMDEAIGLVGGEGSMRSGPGRLTIFNVLMDFANRLSRPVAASKDGDPKTTELADGLFRRAAAAADGPDQQVAYLLARARFDHEVAHDYAAEVDLCQRVLGDAALRRVAVTDDQSAADAAAAAIASAIAVDRSYYAPVETRATASLAEARTKGDPEALLAVAEVYPNSRAAGDARRAAAIQFESTGKPGRAIEVRRDMYGAVSDPLDKAAVLELIAADFLAIGPDGIGPATDRLARAGQLSPNPLLASDLKLPDGTLLHGGQTSYADAVTALRVPLAAADAAKLPDFKLAVRPPRAPANFSPFLPGGPGIPDVTTLVHPTLGFVRNDRVVTWSPAGLAVFDAGLTTPRFRAAEVVDPPVGAAWVGSGDAGRWVVWTPTMVTAVTEAGRPAWGGPVVARDLSTVPAIASGSGTAVVDDAPGTPDGEAQFAQQAINGQIVNIRVAGGGRRAFIVRGNQFIPAPPPPVLSGGEQITVAQPAGPTADVIVVATSTGRLVAIDTAAGKVLWQSRPSDRPADALLANGHFTVARLDEPGGATVIVYDTPTGRVIGRRKFPTDGQLVNVALGEEGTLAITLANAVEVKDLYDPWKEPPRVLVAKANVDAATFANMNQADQLLVRAGRVVTLYNNGQYARAYDLSRPSADATNPLSTGSASPSVTMRLVGPQLFIVQPSNVKRYNLTDPADVSVSPGFLSGGGYRVRGMMLGSDHAVLVNDPVDRGPAGSPMVQWLAVSRAMVASRHVESDLLVSSLGSQSAAGISDWIGTEGGIYFLTGDHRLHARRGARSS